MELADAFTELAYAKDWTPSSHRWFSSRLKAFFAWAEDQGITDLERITAPLVRRYVDERRTAISRTGKPLDSHTLNGHVRAIRALLHWAVEELRYNRGFADRVRTAYEAAAPKPKLAQPKTNTPRATKPKVTLVPIKDVGVHTIDIAGVVDPFYLYEVFGAKQLPLALDRFSKGKLLDEVLPIVQKRHPGVQPAKSANKQGVIAFIVQRVVND